MDQKELEKRCDECFDFIINAATITKADAVGTQKSDELREIANHIIDVLHGLHDSVNIGEISRHINDLKKIDSADN